jgi:hypothetical protein
VPADAHCAHLPRPASGSVRHGRCALSSEQPALLAAISSLASMALLVKVRA